MVPSRRIGSGCTSSNNLPKAGDQSQATPNPFNQAAALCAIEIPVSAYHSVIFRLGPDQHGSYAYVHLSALQPINENKFFISPETLCDVFKTNPSQNEIITFGKALLYAQSNNLGYGLGLLTSYENLPNPIEIEENRERINEFRNSIYLKGINFIISFLAEKIKTHYPDTPIKIIYDAGFRIPQHHEILHNHFTDLLKIIAVDCQHLEEIASKCVTEQQINALLVGQNDQYIKGYATINPSDEFDIILIRNIEGVTAIKKWIEFFLALKENKNWKAIAITCANTGIFKNFLEEILINTGLIEQIADSQNFKAQDNFKLLHHGLTPNAKHINVSWQNQAGEQPVFQCCGPDAYTTVIMRTNPSNTPATSSMDKQGKHQPKLKINK